MNHPNNNNDRSLLRQFVPCGFDLLHIEEHTITFGSRVVEDDIVQIPNRMDYGGIGIVAIRSRNANNEYFIGYEIVIFTQYYGFAAVPVKAALINPHEIVIQLPGWHPSNRHYAFSIEMNAPIVFRIVLLKFPNTIFLSNTIFSPESISGNIVMTSIMIPTTGVIRNYCNVHVLKDHDDDDHNDDSDNLDQN